MPVNDGYSPGAQNPLQSADKAFSVTPDDDADLASTDYSASAVNGRLDVAAISVNVGGIVRYTPRMAEDAADWVEVQLSSGSLHSINPRRIWDTGTTATGIVAHLRSG